VSEIEAQSVPTFCRGWWRAIHLKKSLTTLLRGYSHRFKVGLDLDLGATGMVCFQCLLFLKPFWRGGTIPNLCH
jgi:hypothetical protein